MCRNYIMSLYKANPGITGSFISSGGTATSRTLIKGAVINHNSREPEPFYISSELWIINILRLLNYKIL